jgi:thiamine-phosphate pyrophosphorylase
MPVVLPSETELYALTDTKLSGGRSVEEVAEALLGAGIRILQYREKHMKEGGMLEECRILRRTTAKYGACFIVDDHVDLALLAHAYNEDIHSPGPAVEFPAILGKKWSFMDFHGISWRFPT